jgi:hypothetical protein
MASIALQQPAEGRPKGGGSSRSFSAPHHVSASPGRFASRPGNFSRNHSRYYRPAARSSSAAFRSRGVSGSRYAVNRSTALNPKVYRTRNPQLAASRRAALRAQGITPDGRVLTASSRNWDRSRDHTWRGHRCRWRNNTWVIIDPWFYPWAFGFGYFPYGAYSYYGGGYYDDYAQPEYYDGEAESSVSQVQAALAREGYYLGEIDGSFGPATRSALKRYQRNRGLTVTGQIDQPVLVALGFRQP